MQSRQTGLRVCRVRAERTVVGQSAYPLAIDPMKVCTYPSEVESGAGYFYDDVLEYRVWLHPEKGAKPLNGTHDYFVAFVQYEEAESFSKSNPGTEQPLVLVRQSEWIHEPEHGRFFAEKGERLTEWQADKRKHQRVSEESEGSRPLNHRSTAMATALPPPRQRAAIPRFTSRRIIS